MIVCALIVGGSAATVAACQKSTGSAVDGGMGGSATTYATSACGTCVTSACAGAWGVCGSDPSCAAYLGCLSACPLGPSGDADPTCEAACPAVSGTAGQSAKADLDTCRSTGAGAMCLACGRIPAPQDPIYHQSCDAGIETDPCYQCEDQHCCETYTKCHNDPACHAMEGCMQSCANASNDPVTVHDCWHNCYAASPQAYPDLADLVFSCLGYFCSVCTMPDPCGSCVQLHCADQYAVCARNLQCTLLEDCYYPCAPTDASCFTACESMFPQSVVDLSNAIVECSIQYCSSVCLGTPSDAGS